MELQMKTNESLNQRLGIYEYLGVTWFNAKDVGKLLGYIDTNGAIRKHVDDEDKTTFPLEKAQETGKSHNAMWLKKKGVCKLITCTRKVISQNVLDLFFKYGISIQVDVRYECKEASTLGMIAECFKGCEFQYQKKIGTYFIDMYFPVYRICIECDENGHDDRNPAYERIREKYITEKIKNVKLIRYNPDDKNFNIFKIIGKISQYMLDTHTKRDNDWNDLFNGQTDDEIELLE